MIYKINRKQFEELRSCIKREEMKHKTIYQAVIDYINSIYINNNIITQLSIYD